jgi:hypothetical protein
VFRILGDWRALSGISFTQEERRSRDGRSCPEHAAARHSFVSGIIASVSLHDSTSRVTSDVWPVS